MNINISNLTLNSVPYLTQIRTSETMEEEARMDLPHELMIQILLRLPVKSLIRFKCVSKSWFSLISDTNFANSHFQITQTPRILFISTSTCETRSIDFESSLNDDDSVSASLNLDFLLPESYLNLEIKGSCRGFIFLHCYPNKYLWNPSTGFHKQIPFSPFGSSLYAEYFYGFGYDQSTDDYLLVSMLIDPVTNISSQLEFFSLRGNSWKEIEIEGSHFRYSNPIEDEQPKPGLLFNEAIHWLAYRHDSRLLRDVIVAFDLTERKLFDMDLPDEFDHQLDYCGLWVFGEFLSLWAKDCYIDTIEIWVMKEYKMPSSWTKTHVLSFDSMPSDYFSPLCCTKRGDIIETDGDTGLVKSDDKGQLLEHRSFRNDSHGSHVAIYTESLLSLPCDGEQA